MTLQPATAEDIAAACSHLRALGPLPDPIARGLAANDPAQIHLAFAHLADAGRVAGLRELVDRLRDSSDFGAWARMQSSRLHRDGGDFAAALADVDDLMLRFPQRAAAHWWIARARCLAGLERPAEAEAALRDAVTRFPEDRRAAPLLARAAEKRNDWAAALAVWDDYAARFGADEAQAASGRARALFRLDRIDEATQTLEELVAREPENPAALDELATMLSELGEAARARELRVRLMQRHAASAKPEAWVSLANAHCDLGEDAAGAAALAELERRFPDSALAEIARLRLAKKGERGHDELKAQIEAAHARFPQDFELRGHWIWILLSLGRLDDAERETQALEAEGAEGFAVASRLRLEADRGDASLRALLERWSGEREFSSVETSQLSYLLFEIRTPWAFDAGAKLVAQALARKPAGAGFRYLQIRFAIARRQDDEALALIDALPQRFARPEILELRAWAAARRGQAGEAKALWRRILAAGYIAAVHAPIRDLTRVSPDDRPPPGEGATAYVVFRNEAAQIPAFLAHHRRLGVRRFVFFDHSSTDGGREIALQEPDVVVYDCPDSYQLSSSGRRWVNEIVAREGARGWGLQLDMDEHLIYPGCETLGIDGFIAYLDAHAFEAVRGFMLDVFPPRLIGDDGEPTPLCEHVYYDDDYSWFGAPWPPYLSPSGGVRARLFDGRDYLHKVPLWRLDAGRLINSHETTALRFADVSAALKHTKLMNVALRGRGAKRAGAEFLEADADVEAIRTHSRYAARLAALWRADLIRPGVSRRLEDSLGLAGRGLMEISDGYRRWLDDAANPPVVG